MAEVLPEKLNSENKVYQVRIESVVNGWLVDYYFFLAVEFFKNEQYEDFCAIIDILDCKYNPLPSTDDIAMKFRVLQFISRINEGENLGVSFEMDVPSTPLESALMLLEKISQEFSIPQQEYEKVSTSLKDMVSISLELNSFIVLPFKDNFSLNEVGCFCFYIINICTCSAFTFLHTSTKAIKTVVSNYILFNE
uniref:Telomere repeat-binding factor dimerisation domain-containing protein n=1 Tax=Oreochromis niloticus TaxID=8128 RepID=A0A669EGE4_ORENI